jgi:hypothetical protein
VDIKAGQCEGKQKIKLKRLVGILRSLTAFAKAIAVAQAIAKAKRIAQGFPLLRKITISYYCVLGLLIFSKGNPHLHINKSAHQYILKSLQAQFGAYHFFGFFWPGQIEPDGSIVLYIYREIKKVATLSFRFYKICKQVNHFIGVLKLKRIPVLQFLSLNNFTLQHGQHFFFSLLQICRAKLT